ncbi:MAG: transposase, partial [Eubacterium sp.]|nr:transposase [Eubacterium sp.]
LNIPESLYPYVNDYKMHVFDIAFLSDEQLDMFQSDFKIVAKYFVDRRKNGNPGFPQDIPKHVDEVLKLLSAMTGDERFILGWQNHLREESGNRKEGGTMAEKWIDEIEERGEKRGMIKAYSDIGLSIEQIAKKVEVTVDYVKQVLNPDSLSANL